jgi:hypothetical protein
MCPPFARSQTAKAAGPELKKQVIVRYLEDSFITGGESGTYYRFGLDIQRLISQVVPTMGVTVYPSKGSVENIYALSLNPAKQYAALDVAERRTGIMPNKTRRFGGDDTAWDHDLGCTETYIPCGIVDEERGELRITCDSSYTTSAVIVDTRKARWQVMEASAKTAVEWLQILMDNGAESSGVRTQCLHRMV